MQTTSFYGFRPKTVRSPSQNRMFLVRKPYGFGTENVKGRLPEADSIPFNNTLAHSLLNNLNQNSHAGLQIIEWSEDFADAL